VGQDGKAVVYRSRVQASAMIRKEISRFLDTMFDGSATNLVSCLADMDAVSLDDLRELEKHLAADQDTDRDDEMEDESPTTAERDR
jgi:predicted transcriptional regulator